MKKLITSAVAALALLFGFASCSGDLHDAVSPNAMKGNWFYYELDTSAVTTDTISIIFNNGSAQTEDVVGVAKTGTVEYIWAVPADGSKVTAIKNTRTDCPDKNIGNSTDKLGIYVFTNSSKVNLWAWAGDTNLTGGTWPGLEMSTDAEIKIESEKTYEIKVVSIKGEDPRKYEAGMDYSPNGSFAITPNKDASYTVTIDVSGGSYNCSVE